MFSPSVLFGTCLPSMWARRQEPACPLPWHLARPPACAVPVRGWVCATGHEGPSHEPSTSRVLRPFDLRIQSGRWLS